MLNGFLCVTILTTVCAAVAEDLLPKPFNHEQEQFSVLLPTLRRNDVMIPTVKHYVSCPRVARVFIVWDDPENSPPVFTTPDGSAPHEYVVYQSMTLNNRFTPPPNLATDGVLSIDDDVVVACKDLDFAFRVWQAHSDTLVGFFPRLSSTDSAGASRYLSWRTVWHSGLYSIILTKGSFMHRKWLSAYTELPSFFHEFISNNHNCEDILMNFVVAKEAHLAPLWVEVAVAEQAESGISSGKSHEEFRGTCIKTFTEKMEQELFITDVRVTRFSRLCTKLARVFPSVAQWLC